MPEATWCQTRLGTGFRCFSGGELGYVMSEKPPDDLPHFLDIGRHRDWAGRGRYQWIKRGIIILFVVFIAAALFNVFGQRAVATTTSARGTTLRLTTPRALRLGLIYQTRIDITSAQAIHTPVLVLGSGWFDGETLNSSEPSAVAENHRPRELPLLTLEPRGGHMRVWLQWSVNPTHPVWRRAQSVSLYDGNRLILTHTIHVTVYP